MRIYMTILVLTAVLICVSSLSAAGGRNPGLRLTPEDSMNTVDVETGNLADYPRGIFTTFGRGEFYSSLSSYSHVDYESYIGLGYNVTPINLFTIKIFTGSEQVSADHSWPVLGALAIGGAGLEYRHRFIESGTWRPSAAFSGELTTLLTSGANSGDNGTSGGYNGKALGVQLGLEYFLNRNFSFSVNAFCKYRTYNDLILGGDFKGAPNIGADRIIGLSL